MADLDRPSRPESTSEVMEIARWWAAQPYGARKTIRYDAYMMARELVRLTELASSEKAKQIWQPIDTAPIGKTILLWWTPIDDNKYAEAAVIGQVSEHEKGMWWNGQRAEYETLARITHWLPLPEVPTDAERGQSK